MQPRSQQQAGAPHAPSRSFGQRPSRALSFARPRTSLLLACVSALAALLVFGAVPALATEPLEAPELSVEAHVPSPASTATEAVLHGVVDPGKSGPAGTFEVDSYEFLYAAGAGCEGGAVISGVSLGEGAQQLSETVAGLSPGTHYSVCLRVGNGSESAEATTGFTTTVTPEAPVTREAKSVTGTSAVLRGELDPKVSGTVGYEFVYNDEGLPCEPGVSGTTTAVGAEQTGKGVLVSQAVSGLVPSSTYSFCVVAVNSGGEVADAAPLSFVTPAAKPEVALASTNAAEVSPFSATFHAEVNADDQETTVFFQYSTSASVDGSGSLQGASQVPVAPGSPIGGGFGAVPVEASTGRTLAPSTSYFVQAVAVNASGTSYGEVVEFTTLATEAPVFEEPYPAASVTPFAATLTDEINPESEETSCHLTYGTDPGLSTGTTTVPCEPAWLGLGSEPVGVAVSLPGLAPNTAYFYRFVAENGSSGGTPTEGPIAEFKTLAADPPVIEAGSTSGLTPFAVTLEGHVNPGFQEATCQFVYGTDPALETGTTTVPCTPASLGSGGTPVAVSAAVSGLSPGTTYFFRVLAENQASRTAGKPAEGAIESFATPALEAPVVESETAPAVTPSEAQLATTVAPAFQDTSCSFEYSTDPLLSSGVQTAACEPAALGSGGSGVGASAILTGLTPGTTYYYRVTAINGTGTTTDLTIEQFTTLAASVPVIESETVSNVTQNGASFEAQVNPEYEQTSYAFEYATEESVLLEGKGTTVAGGALPGGSIATGFGEHTAHGQATELSPATLYYYRVVAHNATGQAEQLAAVQSFKTSSVPLASTGTAQSVTASGASLTGSVNPEGLSTTYYFEYGHTTSYERQAPFPQGTLPAGASSTPVSVPVTGLEPGSAYHYRLVATNTSNGTPQTVLGEDETFTTTATPPIITGLTATRVTQSTATITATLNPQGLSTRWQLQLQAPGGPPQPITSGETSTTGPISQSVSGLAPGTEYHYRLTATNPNGMIAPEGAFTTAPPAAGPPPAPLPGVIPFVPITTIQAKETAEDKANSKPPPITRAQKLVKALKACHAKHGHKRHVCEVAARKKYGTTKKKKKGSK